MSMLILISVTALVVVFAFYVRRKRCATIGKSDRDMSGKVAVVTGSNGGIGLETARELVMRNAKVILACRNMAKAEQAKLDIIASTGRRENVRVMSLDLSSMKSVRKFTRDFLEAEDRLNVLVNNATASPDKKTITEDGFDLFTATNVIGPFLLTNLLLPVMVKSSPSRIVNVSSKAHNWGDIDLKDVKGLLHKGFGFNVYAGTKLANCLMSLELSKRLNGTSVTSNSLHPGVVDTPLMKKIFTSRFSTTIYNKCFKYLLKTAKDGAQTSVYAAVSEELEGISGIYLVNCQAVKPNSKASDSKTARLLWETLAEVTGVQN